MSRRVHEDRHRKREKSSRSPSKNSHGGSVSPDRRNTHRSRSRERTQRERRRSPPDSSSRGGGGDRERDRGGGRSRRDSYIKQEEADSISVRLLIDAPLVGGLIGKGGEIVNALRREMQTNIEIQDSPMGVKKRVVTVKGEAGMVSKTLYSIAMRLKAVESKLADGSRDRDRDRERDRDRDRERDRGGRECSTTILVPALQVGILIGKGGEVINGIRQTTGASVKVAAECLPGTDEKTMEIKGSDRAVKDCVELVIDQLRSKRAQEKGGPIHPYIPVVEYNGGRTGARHSDSDRDRHVGSQPVASPMFPPNFNPAMFLPFGLLPGLSGFPPQGDMGGFGSLQAAEEEDRRFADEGAMDYKDDTQHNDRDRRHSQVKRERESSRQEEEETSGLPSLSSPFLSVSGPEYQILVPFPVTVESVITGSDGENLEALMKQFGSQIKVLPHDDINDGVTEQTLLISGGSDANDKTIAALYDMMTKKDDKREASDRFKKL